MTQLAIVPIACLRDNYAYLLIDPATHDAVVVDASEAAPVAAELSRRQVKLRAVLSTHHHLDHVGGNEELARAHPGLRIFGHVSDAQRIPGFTDGLVDGAGLRAGSIDAQAMHVPGHTLGAVTYLFEGAAFTGDTLFLAGCGRLFEGTAPMMYQSLNERLARLDPATRIYCGHEYTVSNLQFAAHLQPQHQGIRTRLDRALDARRRGEPTVGATLGEELATNPFLRCDDSDLRASIGAGPDMAAVDVFAVLRSKKDVYRSPPPPP